MIFFKQKNYNNHYNINFSYCFFSPLAFSNLLHFLGSLLRLIFNFFSFHLDFIIIGLALAFNLQFFKIHSTLRLSQLQSLPKGIQHHIKRRKILKIDLMRIVKIRLLESLHLLLQFMKILMICQSIHIGILVNALRTLQN